MRINGTELRDGERGVFAKSADAARRKYLRTHGGSAVPVPEGDRVPSGEVPVTDRVSGACVVGWRSEGARASHVMAVRESAAAWRTAHQSAYDAAADRAGTSAVKRLHTGRVRMLETGRAGGVTGEHLDRLQRAADDATARLTVLGMAGGRKVTPKRVAAVAVPAMAMAAAVAGAADDMWAPRVPAVPEPAPVRKTSKLIPCDRHAAGWGAVGGRRKYENACEGGNGDSECAPGVCVLIPGTDHYTRELAAGGPVELAVLNGGASQLPPHLCLTSAGHVGPRPGVTDAPDPEPLRPDDIAPPVVYPVAEPMTRAARKVWRRELADSVRAAGLEPRGDVWTLVTVGGVAPADVAAMTADDIANAAAQLATVEPFGGAL